MYGIAFLPGHASKTLKHVSQVTFSFSNLFFINRCLLIHVVICYDILIQTIKITLAREPAARCSHGEEYIYAGVQA